MDDENACWPWTGALDGKGYGNIGLLQRSWIRAHRLSYELHYGDIPPGAVVRHKCDNKRCVNPNHLEIGTQGDNLRDSYERSDREGFVRVVPDEVVRQIAAADGLHKEIASQYGVTRSYVGAVKAGLRRSKTSGRRA